MDLKIYEFEDLWNFVICKFVNFKMCIYADSVNSLEYVYFFIIYELMYIII